MHGPMGQDNFVNSEIGVIHCHTYLRTILHSEHINAISRCRKCVMFILLNERGFQPSFQIFTFCPKFQLQEVGTVYYRQCLLLVIEI